jgi:hypothetical protein
MPHILRFLLLSWKELFSKKEERKKGRKEAGGKEKGEQEKLIQEEVKFLIYCLPPVSFPPISFNPFLPKITTQKLTPVPHQDAGSMTQGICELYSQVS